MNPLNWTNGNYQCRNENLQPLVDRTCATLKEIHALFGADNVTLVHVPRERHGEADALANLAMDSMALCELTRAYSERLTKICADNFDENTEASVIEALLSCLVATLTYCSPYPLHCYLLIPVNVQAYWDSQGNRSLRTNTSSFYTRYEKRQIFPKFRSNSLFNNIRRFLMVVRQRWFADVTSMP